MHLVVVIDQVINYERFFHLNKQLSGEKIHPVFSKGKKNIASELGKVLSGLFSDAQFTDDWVLVCPDGLEILEKPSAWLGAAAPGSIWGISGYRTVKNLRGKVLCEQVGVVRTEEDGKMFCRGLDAPSGATVDSLACGALLFHYSLLKEHALAFDSRLPEALYAEDFSLSAKLRGIESKIFHMPCVVHCDSAAAARSAGKEAKAYFKEKHPGKEASAIAEAGSAAVSLKLAYQPSAHIIYHYGSEQDQHNMTCVAALPLMRQKAKILDVGCAYGDVGTFFKKQLDAILWGLEYDAGAIEYARRRNIYQELAQVDLDVFDPSALSKYYRFFDQLFLGDVLEHLRNPLDTLKKLELLLQPEGSMVVSLPNVAHNYVLANLLAGRFDYDVSGLLDSTHIRFFTWQTQAELFAKAGLRVLKATACFMGPNENRRWRTPRDLPYSFYKFTHASKHFHVQQYISELAVSELPYFELLAENEKMLQEAPENNAAGWNYTRIFLEKFEGELPLARNAELPNDLRIRLFMLCYAGQTQEAMAESGLFDPVWYLKKYPDIAALKVDPFEHYCSVGWQEGRRPSEYFDPVWYAENYPTGKVKGNPLGHYLYYGYRINAKRTKPDEDYENDAAGEYVGHVFEAVDGKDDFIPLSDEKFTPQDGDPKIIAYYLPQYYPNPANDRWWEKGFTEWTNATKTPPQYPGHYQPHLPIDMGFYDLRLTEPVRRQAELARQYGVHGFCYYYYWFDGKKMLDMPVYRLLEHPEIDLPFSVAWANEPWTANWDGGKKNLLVAQSQTIKAELLFRDLLPLFQDSRYIKIDGKPVFTVYRPTFFEAEHFCAVMDKLRNLAVKHGFSGLHIILVKRRSAAEFSLADYNGDAFGEFPPHGFPLHRMSTHVLNPNFMGNVYDMRLLVNSYKQEPDPSDLTYRCVMPMWDNSPRRARQGCVIFDNHSPETYEDWLSYAINSTKRLNPEANQLVFVNAWNEWSEGAHLEPDRRHGYAYLEATKRAIIKCRSK